ncbi:sugar phosphate isomerase/epimerase family protein [Rhodalgimonas zhirmunskyi]|uniref:Sugar phosphate isomerase/epimerase n=1 Tax=Rhodalgimonas zhirmunskyi TaxID=2964767 RepID=A0AAJ1U5F0_9RHOB|nr:sugar phosphate isomerase/epimerase family protein [Rhodoalgimonas zhirmunskyi]MDQ2093359.1 sugar phosphate isomerase/epimerase [Rhodoalgimonas zhirmunskyi]
MSLPLLGVAIKRSDLDVLRDWIFEPNRAIEIQDFVMPDLIAGDCAPLIADYQAALAGHEGPRGIHGPFFGLDLSNPDAEIRAVIQQRLLKGLEIAEALGGSHMVVHSPFTYWHLLNRDNYPDLHDSMIEAIAACLDPVLARAGDIGCIVMLENIDDTDPRHRREAVERIDHPNLKLSLDTGHAELAHGCYGAPPVVDFIAQAGGLLGHVHLQDADGWADRHWHPGEGRVPWPAVFAALGRLEQSPRLILEVRGRLGQLPATVAALKERGLAC